MLQQWGVSFNSQYYKCYKFVLPRDKRKFIRGFSAVFYLKKYTESQMTAFNLTLENLHATGLQIAIHAPGTVPDMKLGMNISPGMETTIALTHTLTTHLPEPYSACTDQTSLGASDNVTTYTQGYCLELCGQQQYVDNCNCIYSTLQFSPQQLIDVNYNI